MNSAARNPDAQVKVTVLLPCHRADEYLRLAIRSILQQSLHDLELLVITDWGLRGHEADVLRFTEGDHRARLVPSLRVGGLAAGLNLGITEAKGDYIARMDGDDLSLPGRLAAQADYLDAHPEVAALGCRLEMMDEDGTTLERPYPFYETDRDIRAVLPLRNPMPHPAMMFRRDALLAVGGYKYAHSAEDWELFLRIARDRTRKLHNLDQVLVRYRRHAAQITRPELSSAVFYETSGFLFTELLRTGSPKYLLAILIKLPWVVRTRLALRRLRGSS